VADTSARMDVTASAGSVRSEVFRKAGHAELAEKLDREIVGRNVIEGRWTFQIVEDYDDGYYAESKGCGKACP
jgi:hypothetical protein